MGNKFDNHIVHESIRRTVKSLKKAHKIASNNRDIEALILISERWMALMQRVDELDKYPQKMIGFVSDSMMGQTDE